MQNTSKDNYKYVFVCGLQRSGTSVLGRNLGRLQNVASFKNTGVRGDEGQFLQDIYPDDYECGGSGRFGFDPRAHLTETSPLLTPENAAKLQQAWHRYWDKSKRICLEKSPGNLIKTRFLQAVFPNSCFVIIRRHPLPVTMATQKWKSSAPSFYRLIEHWLYCHELFERDKKYLKHVYELRYEDYINDPDRYHQEIAAFIGTNGLTVEAMEDLTDVHDKKYFQRWSDLITRSFFRSYYQYIARRYEPRLAKYGYSLRKSVANGDVMPNDGHKFAAALGPVYCLGADTAVFLWRYGLRSRWYVKQQIKAVLPEFVLRRIRQARQKAAGDRAARGQKSEVSGQKDTSQGALGMARPGTTDQGCGVRNQPCARRAIEQN